MIDRRPAVITQCESAEDVATAVRFARDLDLKIAVRGGGHSVSGSALGDGALVVDLRRMHEVTVHPGARAVRVEGGATMSHLDRACAPYALATTGGRASTTGVGGFVLGGGSGWLDRKCGLAVDNLLGVELVTADGSVVETTSEEHPELFWALHGGGGNFGVATALTLRLHELPAMAIAFVLYLPEHGAEVLRTYRDLLEGGPVEASGGVIFLTGPPDDEFVPAHLAGRLVCAALLTYAGPEERLRELARPLLAVPHEAAMVTAIPYADLQCMIDDPPGMRNYWSAEYLSSAPDAFVDVFCARAASMPVPTGTQHILFPQRGDRLRSRGLPGAVPGIALGGAPVRHLGGSGRRRTLPAVGQGRPGGRGAVEHRRGVPELHRGRGLGPGGLRARRGQHEAAGPGEAGVRPGQRLPLQPQHPARLRA